MGKAMKPTAKAREKQEYTYNPVANFKPVASQPLRQEAPKPVQPVF
jgi:hypothetical protein